MYKIKFLYVVMAVCLITFSSCNNDDVIEPDANMEYAFTIGLSTIGGSNNSSSTRIIDDVGAFTADYDAAYVYMHSVSDKNKYVRLPIQNDCPDCASGKCFKYFFCKNDNGTYTIRSTDGNEATFGIDEEIYFSSEQDESWTGKNVDASPITGQSILVRDENKNKEIFRSDGNYTLQDVFDLGLNGTLLMKRMCSAFRVYFLFTDLDEPLINTPTAQQYYISPENFEKEVGENPYNFSGKLYIGPYFCDEYNINTGEVNYADEHTNGYYVTNEQKYVPFTDVTYSRTEGTVTQTFMGYGVSTANAEYLVTPYDVNKESNFTFYAFIKNNTNTPESDDGSKYVSYSWDSVPEFNTTQVIVIIYNIRELAKAFNTTNKTRCMEKEPGKLDIKPVKVFYYKE